MKRLLVLYWLVYATAYSVAYTGPFQDMAVCTAALKGAQEIEKLPFDCVRPEQYDDYLMDASFYTDTGGIW